MIAWLAVVLGINSTRNAGNFTLLLIPHTTADHAIIYTNNTEQSLCKFEKNILLANYSILV